MRRLVVFGGPPCGGKSTVARLLPYAHLEMDAIRQRLMPDSSHTRADRAVAYRAVLWAAELLIPQAGIVLVDGGFGRAEDRAACRETARRAEAELRVVEFQIPLEVAIWRNRDRRAAHPGLDLDDERVTELVRNYPWSQAALSVLGTDDPKVLAAAIRSYVEEASASSVVYE